MNIRDQVLTKIAELGEEAPAYFNRSVQTINIWIKTPAKIPLEAIEKVMEESEDERDTQAPPQDITDPVATISPDELANIWNHLQNLNDRVAALEVPHQLIGSMPPQVQQATSRPLQANDLPRSQMPSVIEPDPNDSNAGSMTRPGRQDMRVVPPNEHPMGFAPTQQQANPQPIQPQVQPTTMPPAIFRAGRSWLTPHPPRR